MPGDYYCHHYRAPSYIYFQGKYLFCYIYRHIIGNYFRDCSIGPSYKADIFQE